MSSLACAAAPPKAAKRSFSIPCKTAGGAASRGQELKDGRQRRGRLGAAASDDLPEQFPAAAVAAPPSCCVVAYLDMRRMLLQSFFHQRELARACILVPQPLVFLAVSDSRPCRPRMTRGPAAAHIYSDFAVPELQSCAAAVEIEPPVIFLSFDSRYVSAIHYSTSGFAWFDQDRDFLSVWNRKEAVAGEQRAAEAAVREPAVKKILWCSVRTG